MSRKFPTSYIFCVLAGISFAIGIFFFIRVSLMPKPTMRQAPTKEEIKELLLEARKIREALEEGDDLNISSNEMLLTQILWEIKEVRFGIKGVHSAVGGLTTLIYFVAGTLLGGEFVIIGILWSLRRQEREGLANQG